jgi:hypothetical protein
MRRRTVVYFPENRGKFSNSKIKCYVANSKQIFAKFGHVSSVRAGLGQVLGIVFESFHKPCCYHC